MIIGLNRIIKTQNTICPDCKGVQNPINKTKLSQAGDTLQLSFKGNEPSDSEKIKNLAQKGVFSDRKELAEGLDEVADKETHDSLVKIFAEDRHPDIRALAAEEITRKGGSIKNSQECAEVCEGLATDKSLKVRKKLFKNVGNLPQEKHQLALDKVILAGSKDKNNAIQRLTLDLLQDGKASAESFCDALKNLQELPHIDKEVRADAFKIDNEDAKCEEA